MKSKKFIKDYRLKEDFLANGKIKTKAEYVGDLYFFSKNEEFLKKYKKFSKVIMPIMWLMFICALILTSNATKTTYVIVPFVIAAFPLIFLSEALLEFIRAKQPLTREKADKLINKLPICSFLIILFSGGALVAFVLKAVFSPFFVEFFMFGDLIFIICNSVIVIAAILIFKNRKIFSEFRIEKKQSEEITVQA